MFNQRGDRRNQRFSNDRRSSVHINQDLRYQPPDSVSFSYYHNNGNRNNCEDYTSGNFYFSNNRYRNRNENTRHRNFHQLRSQPYDRNRISSHQHKEHSRAYCNDSQLPTSSSSQPNLLSIPPSPQEVKTLRLMAAVQSQKGISGQLVLLQNDKDNASVILQNAVQSIRSGILSVVPGKSLNTYELKINGEFIVAGEFPNKQTAKNGLCDLACENLRKTCFLIQKKRNYEEISTEDIGKFQSDSPKPKPMEGSKAHLMMLKMGWGGKGLGVNEQGAEKSVAETISQNITKEGLGGKNIMTEINKILEDFAKSTKVTTLAFDSGFTKEERAHIHNLAAKLNLKSKSEGKDQNRRITIGKKIARWDLVKELLLSNCENESFKLVIPSDFQSMWEG